MTFIATIALRSTHGILLANRRFRHEAVYDVHSEERSHELRSHNSRPL
jgi:hypothetical protein